MAAYKADFIFYDLLSKIYQRNYTENKLPTQRKLAEQYGVSRFTIQSVLNRMQHMGLIHSVQGDAIYIDVAASKNSLMLNSMIERPYSEIKYPSVYLKTGEKLIEKVIQIIPGLRKVNCALGTKFVSTAEEKLRINRDFNCDIVEMEAAGILLIADMHNICVLFVKGISDSLHGGNEEFLATY